MDNPSMPDQPIPGTEGYGGYPAPQTLTLEDEMSISMVIDNIAAGQFSSDAGRLLARLVKEVKDQGSKGKLIIELEVVAKDGRSYVTVGGSSKATMPKFVFESVFYPDDSGRLSRESPQSSFSF